jgi:hypothetical protein
VKFGFESTGWPIKQPDPSYDPDEYEDGPGEPGLTGHVGQLTVPKDFDNEDEDEDEQKPAWAFLHDIYVSIQVGPFVLVIGKPE